MRTPANTPKTVAGLLAATLIGGAAWTGTAVAGAADVTDQSGNSMKFEYDGASRIRMSSGENGTYMLILDDKVYAVSDANGSPMVMDMGQTYKMLPDQFKVAGPEAAAGKFISLKRGSGSTTVAGVKGDNYELRYVDDKGVEQVNTVVLSTDKRAREFTHALLGMTTAMTSIVGQSEDAGRELAAELENRGMGVLKWGENMQVTALSDRAVAAERFELPAAPADLSAFGALGRAMEGAGAPAATDADGEEESSGGMFSRMMGALGGKAEETTDKAEDSVEREVDERTDNAIENAVDKAFGKIFGD